METVAKRRKDLNRRLVGALIAPVTVFLLMAVALVVEIRQMDTFLAWVDHSDTVISRARSLREKLTEQDAAAAAFSASNDDAELVRLTRASALVPIDDLRSLLSDNPAQLARLDRVARAYQAWLESRSLRVLTDGKKEGDARAVADSRQELAGIVELTNELIAAERELRTVRRRDVGDAQRTLNWTIGALFVVGALSLAFISRSQLSGVASAYDEVLDREREGRELLERDNWLRRAGARVTQLALAERTTAGLADELLSALVRETDAVAGAIYTKTGDSWERAASMGLPAEDGAAPTRLSGGEGLVARVMAEEKVFRISEIPAESFRVRSSLLAETLGEIVVMPARADDKVHAFVELAFVGTASARAVELLERLQEPIAIAVRGATYLERQMQLLDGSQRQARVLEEQRAELQRVNEELEEQRDALRDAGERLEAQSAALQDVNTRLEQRAAELAGSQEAFVKMADEAARASRHKSEFLANMSHELRTPLNSILILAKHIQQNPAGTASEEERQHAATIHAAGSDLLQLIDDILNLAKVEAGHVDVDPHPLECADLAASMRRLFEPLAQEKKLELVVTCDDDVPTITTDRRRVDQIVRNLLANALKFTTTGSVTLRIKSIAQGVRFDVSDTGPGIAHDEQEAIFEPFHQADSTRNRGFGGTGLGLSIARKLARALGGDLVLASEPGRGSTFSLGLPVHPERASEPVTPDRAALLPRASSSPPPEPLDGPGFDDDRDHPDLAKGYLLVVEDDPVFARLVFDVAAELGSRCVVAPTAEAALVLAERAKPSDVLLDVGLPDHTGLYVLDRFKQDPRLQDVPVFVASVSDGEVDAMALGATRFLRKAKDHGALRAQVEQIVTARRRPGSPGEERPSPTTAMRTLQGKRVLLAEDDVRNVFALSRVLEARGARVTIARNGLEALEALEREEDVAVVLMDVLMPKMDGLAAIREIRAREKWRDLPILALTAKAMPEDRKACLMAGANDYVPKPVDVPMLLSLLRVWVR